MKAEGQEPTLIRTSNLCVNFTTREGLELRALERISMHILPGEAVGLIGESGCGKSTLARVLTGLQKPGADQLFFKEKPVPSAGGIRRLGPEVQLVFQDPFSSLNPRLRVWNQVSEPLRGHRGITDRRALKQAAESALRRVDLRPEDADKFPHQFSGGQRQRIAIARALVIGPSLLVADEPMASLDLPTQQQLTELLRRICRDEGMALLLISHDLSGIAALTSRSYVMYLGRIVESGPTKEILSSPAHPYTRLLASSAPTLQGRPPENPPAVDPPSPTRRPQGCAFHPRCPRAADVCRRSDPPLVERSSTRADACLLNSE